MFSKQTYNVFTSNEMLYVSFKTYNFFYHMAACCLARKGLWIPTSMKVAWNFKNIPREGENLKMIHRGKVEKREHWPLTNVV